MVDLGVFNYVRNALAEGKSKELISASLAKGGMSTEAIEEAFVAVSSGIAPAHRNPSAGVGQRDIPLSTHTIVTADEHRPMAITLLCGYIFFASFLTIVRASLASVAGQLPFTFTLEACVAVFVFFTTLASFLGYWHMKRWGVMLLLLTTLLSFLSLMSHVQFDSSPDVLNSIYIMASTLLFPSIALSAGFAHFNDMS